MKINRIFNKVALASMITSLVTPLAVLVPRVSAAPDTCVWTGGGTPIVDTPNQTITFDIADPANWSTCDNANVPEDGDTLEFPANLAQVDPGGTLSDDYSWKYEIDNTLTDGTAFAGINFTGDTGATCQYHDASTNPNNDVYYFTGNSIILNGDVNNDYTNECSRYLSYFLLDVTVSGSTTLDINNQASWVGGVYESGQIHYGLNTLTICDPTHPSLSNRYAYIDGLDGDGDVEVNCGATFGSNGSWGTGRSITVNSGYVGVSDSQSITDITLEDEAYIQLNLAGGSAYDEQIIATDLTFNGGPKPISGSAGGGAGNGGGGGGGTPTYTSTSKTPEQTVYPRLYVNYTEYDSEENISLPRDVKFTGDITFVEDLEVQYNANVNIAGKVVGNGKKISARTGSIGSFKVTSTDNTSTTSGSVKADYDITEIDGEYGDSTTGLYDLYVPSGSFTYLKTAESKAKDVTVQPYGKFGGLGTVGVLDVKPMAVYAPGLSPGCINTGNLTISGTYEIEINGASPCTGYDQTDVTGAVDVTGGTLNVSMLDSFNPTLNQEFIIIDNDAADAVVGTFTGLAEGASIEINGVTLGISYVGGDGNDVVLSATAVPATETAPDTGIGSIISNPLISLLALSLTGATLVGLRKVNLNKK